VGSLNSVLVGIKLTDWELIVTSLVWVSSLGIHKFVECSEFIRGRVPNGWSGLQEGDPCSS
jgi:hypothetical protein